MSSTLASDKKALRQEAVRRRDAAAAALGPDGARRSAEAAATLLIRRVPIPADGAVSAYWPMGNEFDPRPIMERLAADGRAIALPVVVARGAPLVFRAWAPGDALEPAPFGTQVPFAARPEIRPRVLVVPLLAFDRAGYRLGYGGGFYDRTLAALRAAGGALAVGLAYAAQEVESVPRDEKDARLDWIVTEDEAIEVR